MHEPIPTQDWFSGLNARLSGGFSANDNFYSDTGSVLNSKEELQRRRSVQGAEDHRLWRIIADGDLGT